jgi:ectoine hydroxylase
MRLTAAQVEDFERRGFLLCEGVFAAAEVAALEGALQEVVASRTDRVVVDAASGTVRMVHGSHLHVAAFARLARHPRLVGPAERLLGAPVYVYQSRLNLKAGLAERPPSSGYPWHQDFSTWHHRDGLPEPRAVVVFTFLDEVTPCNAPLMVVPASHRRGIVGAPEGGPGSGWGEGGYRQIVIPPGVLAELVDEGGILAVTGGPGSVLFMHSNVVHGSTENISPRRRALYSLVFAAAGNRATRGDSPEHFAARDAAPIEPLADDCLLA